MESYSFIVISIPLGLISVYSKNVSKSIITLMGEHNWSPILIDNYQPTTSSLTYSERHLIFSKNLPKSSRLTDTLYVLFGDHYKYNEDDYKAKLIELTI